MKYRFHPEAAEEFWAACQYYSQIEPRLGTAFVGAVEAALGHICQHPKAWQEVEEDIRRHLLRRFPFGIYYSLERDHILILAILHMKRQPGYWRTRLP